MYQLINPCPHNKVIIKPNTIKGPKGIESFLDLILVSNKNTDIIPPKIKDKNIFKNISLIPNTKPKEPIKFTSPPPIPPRDKITISKNKPPAKISPPIELSKLIEIWFI